MLPVAFAAGGRAHDCPVALQQFSVRKPTRSFMTAIIGE